MSRTRRQPGRETGFTLIELMMVVLIIAMLVGILLPSIAAITRAGHLMSTEARLARLGAGADLYKKETSFYPGVKYRYEWEGDLTGSQVLARALLTPVDGSGEFPDSTIYFRDFSAELLGEVSGRANTFVDATDRQSAICYYPALPREGGLQQFKESDNRAYTDGNKDGSFIHFIRKRDTEGDLTTTPHRDGQYLLIAPGADGEYFNGDDVTNFRGSQ